MKYQRIFLVLTLFLISCYSYGQQTIWSETFDLPDKGYWGDGSGIAAGDMSGISKWMIDVSSCALTISTRYIKTVSTSGGRLQAVAINGEAIWSSEIINISSKQNVTVSIAVSETGTSTNTSKYVKLYYKLDGGSEILFEKNGENIGNFGSLVSGQLHLNGNTLQLIARINNPNTGDACIIDNVLVSFDNVKPCISKIASINSKILRAIFTEPIEKTGAENVGNYSVNGIGNPVLANLNADNTSIDLTFSSDFVDLQTYNFHISGISDLNENLMHDTTLNFVYKEFKCNTVYATSENQIILIFSHPLNLVSANNLNNYNVNNGIGIPSAATLLSDTTVSLLFSNNFENNTNYEVSISNLNNVYNLSLPNSIKNYTWHHLQEFDLIINELMLDINPAPNVLPPAKYIELQNRSSYDIYLSGWKLQIGDNSLISLPNLNFGSKNYLVICSSSQLEAFKPFGTAIGLLSESQLTTTGKQIYLFDNENKMIDYLNYSDSWYRNSQKTNGGWSLERIDADNFCGESLNWSASNNFKGGTPGEINSINAANPDISKPTLQLVKVLSSSKLGLSFSKNIDSETGLNPTNYQLENGINLPVQIGFSDTSHSSIILQFSSQFIDTQEQTLSVKNLKDFCGNAIDPVSSKFTYKLISPKSIFPESDKILHLIFSEEVDIISAQKAQNYLVNNGLGNPVKAIKHSTRKNEVYLEFAGNMSSGQNYSIQIESVKDLDGNIIKPCDLSFVYYEPKHNDLVINEVLFNPKSGGVDFVEIYNKSGFPVDLSKIRLASRNDDGNIESAKALADNNVLYENSHFMAISIDSLKLKNNYPAISYDKFRQIASMPSFNDDQGIVVLLYGDSVIDEFEYNANMHFGLISNAEGVSLERIDPDKTTQIASNWHSASQSRGFATPANQNSQFRKSSETVNSEVLIEPETFSPNNDGYNDLTFIRYKFDEPGYVANVSVYDGKGRLLKRLASNELLAIEGEFSWDGLNENGTKANLGIYVVYFEVFNLQGIVKQYKNVCVVAEKLK